MWLIEKEIKQRFLINPDFILHLLSHELRDMFHETSGSCVKVEEEEDLKVITTTTGKGQLQNKYRWTLASTLDRQGSPYTCSDNIRHIQQNGINCSRR